MNPIKNVPLEINAIITQMPDGTIAVVLLQQY